MWVGEPPHTRLTAPGRAGRSGNRGQILGLGVKPWGVDAENSQCRAILYGVTIGVAAISCYQQGKQSARLSAEHNWRG